MRKPLFWAGENRRTRFVSGLGNGIDISRGCFITSFRHPKVPPTNNQAERSLRPVVIMRKIVHGTRSDKGLENHSVLRSLFETARRQGKKSRLFFLDLFTKTTAQAQAALYRRPATAKPRPTLRR